MFTDLYEKSLPAKYSVETEKSSEKNVDCGNQGQTMSHMMKKEVLYMSTEKVIAILAALLADQENVKVSYEIHKDNYAEEKTA